MRALNWHLHPPESLRPRKISELSSITPPELRSKGRVVAQDLSQPPMPSSPSRLGVEVAVGGEAARSQSGRSEASGPETGRAEVRAVVEKEEGGARESVGEEQLDIDEMIARRLDEDVMQLGQLGGSTVAGHGIASLYHLKQVWYGNSPAENSASS